MLFPMVWTMGAAKVTLEADGTCHGDLQGMLDVLAKLPPDPQGPMIWLLAHAVRMQLMTNAFAARK